MAKSSPSQRPKLKTSQLNRMRLKIVQLLCDKKKKSLKRIILITSSKYPLTGPKPECMDATPILVNPKKRMSNKRKEGLPSMKK